MRKFDTLFNKIITEYVNSEDIEDIETKIRDVFFKVMPDACDLAEMVFNSDKEREAYIFNVWVDFSDDIIEYVEGEFDEDELKNLDKDELEDAVKSAICNNSKSILGVDSIFE